MKKIYNLGNGDLVHALGRIMESAVPMLDKAIKNAKFHGVDLHPGVRNLGHGNCAFESIIDSINTRSCFPETYDGTPDYWRRVWMTEVEQTAFTNWHGSKKLN